MAKTFFVTRAGLEQMKAEYDSFDSQISSTLAAMGDSVKRDFDLRENPEFMELRVKAMHTLPKQKDNLYWKIQSAVVIEDTREYQQFDGTTVIIGSIVTFTMAGEEKRFAILGPTEADFTKKILAYDAPLADAMIGKHVGDSFEFNGRKIVIIKIEKYEL